MQTDNTHTPETHNGERIISNDGYTMTTLCRGNNNTQMTDRLVFMTVYKRRGHKDTWVMDSGIAIQSDAFKTMSTHINEYIADYKV